MDNPNYHEMTRVLKDLTHQIRKGQPPTKQRSVGVYLLGCPSKLGSMVRINGLFHLLINGIYCGYNPLTNLLLTSWDIQVYLYLYIYIYLYCKYIYIYIWSPPRNLFFVTFFLSSIYIYIYIEHNVRCYVEHL